MFSKEKEEEPSQVERGNSDDNTVHLEDGVKRAPVVTEESVERISKVWFLPFYLG